MDCPKCGYWTPLCKCNGNGDGFNTPKDKLFEFTTYFRNKRFEIRDKAQWKRYMKQHGLHDDVPKKPDFSKPTYKPVPRAEKVACIMKEIKEKGLYEKFKHIGRR